MKFDGTIIALCVAALIVGGTLLHAHRHPNIQFSLFDLVMEGGRVSKIAVAFMLVLGLSAWVIVHLTINDKLTEGYYTIFNATWITPLIAKVVFNKNEPTPKGE